MLKKSPCLVQKRSLKHKKIPQINSIKISLGTQYNPILTLPFLQLLLFSYSTVVSCLGKYNPIPSQSGPDIVIYFYSQS